MDWLREAWNLPWRLKGPFIGVVAALVIALVVVVLAGGGDGSPGVSGVLGTPTPSAGVVAGLGGVDGLDAGTSTLTPPPIPTAVSTSTPTPQPSPTSTPTATPPPPQPIVIELNGFGDSVTEPFTLARGLAIFTGSNDGDSNFIAELIDWETGEIEGLGINDIGPVTDTSNTVRVPRTGLYILDVLAVGGWRIVIEQPNPLP